MSSVNEKPSIDFFKDIFENSSSDEESTKDDEKAEVLDSPTKNSKIGPSKSEESLHEIHSVSSHHQSNSEIREKNVEVNNTENNSSVQNSHKKVGFGVFANLDLDALNQRKSTNKSLTEKDIPKTNEEDAVIANSSKNESTAKQPKSEELYGPELPPNFLGTFFFSITHMLLIYFIEIF